MRSGFNTENVRLVANYNGNKVAAAIILEFFIHNTVAKTDKWKPYLEEECRNDICPRYGFFMDDLKRWQNWLGYTGIGAVRSIIKYLSREKLITANENDNKLWLLRPNLYNYCRELAKLSRERGDKTRLNMSPIIAIDREYEFQELFSKMKLPEDCYKAKDSVDSLPKLLKVNDASSKYDCLLEPKSFRVKSTKYDFEDFIISELIKHVKVNLGDIKKIHYSVRTISAIASSCAIRNSLKEHISNLNVPDKKAFFAKLLEQPYAVTYTCLAEIVQSRCWM